jgi:hypothetical protein
MSSTALYSSDIAVRDHPVRISVLVVGAGTVKEPVKVSGPVQRAVREVFAHPRLADDLQTLHMDPDRLIGRIVSRWESPEHEHETRQLWEKSDGSTTARWWIDRDLRSRTPNRG